MICLIIICIHGLENNSENKRPVLNEIVGVKSSADGNFYRARITEITGENNYDVVFIDFGFEESVNITDIVPLSIQLQQVTFQIIIYLKKKICFIQ